MVLYGSWDYNCHLISLWAKELLWNCVLLNNLLFSLIQWEFDFFIRRFAKLLSVLDSVNHTHACQYFLHMYTADLPSDFSFLSFPWIVNRLELNFKKCINPLYCIISAILFILNNLCENILKPYHEWKTDLRSYSDNCREI